MGETRRKLPFATILLLRVLSIDGHKGSSKRHYYKRRGALAWVSDEQWSERAQPFASAIDTELLKAHSCVLLSTKYWVEPQIDSDDYSFHAFSVLSIEDCHKNTGYGSNDGVPPKAIRRAARDFK